MSWKREQLKKALRAQLETQLEAMLEKVTDEQQLTLTEIEELGALGAVQLFNTAVTT